MWYQTSPGNNADYPLYRKATADGSLGRSVTFQEIANIWQIDNNPAYEKHWDDRSKTPWATNDAMTVSYDDKRSITEKIRYANAHNLGGIMIWAINQDADDSTLLRTVFSGVCNASVKNTNTYKCNPLGTEKRWWTSVEDTFKAGLCGKSAPLYNGFYPVCDPDDPGFSCCSASGFC